MDIIAGKIEIVQRISEEQDASVILAVKHLLDNLHNVHPNNEDAINRELDDAINEADRGELLLYDNVLAEFRNKYSV